MKRITLTSVMFLMATRLWALSVTPSLQNFELKAGDSTEGEVLVANTEEEEISVRPTTKTWFLLPDNQKIKIDDWLQIPSAEFSLKPGESKKLRIKVHAPKKAVGELVGMLSFHTKSPTRTTVEFVLSAAVYLAVSGTEKISGNIDAMMVTPSTDAVNAGVLLRNTGNVHLRPAGILEILNSKDQIVANVELERGQPTYPGNQRPYLGVVKDLRLPPGKYYAQIELFDFDRRVVIDKKRQKFTLSEDMKVKF